MFKIYDLVCVNKHCLNFQVPDIDVWLECINGILETRSCTACSKQLGIEIPAPKGYVKGTKNPVKYH